MQLIYAARMLATWNIPVFTPVGTHTILNDKTIFKTLTNLAYSIDDLTLLYSIIAEKYSWTDLAVIYDAGNTFYGFAGIAIAGTIVKGGVNVTTIKLNHFTETAYKTTLLEASKWARGRTHTHTHTQLGNCK